MADSEMVMSVASAREQHKTMGFARGASNYYWAIVLFMLSGPFPYFLNGVDPRAPVFLDPTTLKQFKTSSDLPELVVKMLFTFLGLLPLTLAPRKIIAGISANIWLALFVLLAYISYIWSDVPSYTLRVSTLLLIPVLVGYAIGAELDSKRAAQILLYSGILMAVASLVWVAVRPSEAIHGAYDASQSGHAGALRGVYTHKNLLGNTSAAFVVIALFWGRALLGSRVRHLIASGLLIGECFATTSASGILIVFMGIGAYFSLFRLRGAARVAAVIFAPAALLLGVQFGTGLFLTSVGRDASLSGRTQIWAMSLRAAGQQLVHGYGYGSPTYGHLIADLLRLEGVDHPHNGYIDIMLGLGVPGLVLLLSAIVYGLAGMLHGKYRLAIKDPGIGALSMFIVCWLLSSLSESSFKPNTPLGFWGFATLSILSIELFKFAPKKIARFAAPRI